MEAFIVDGPADFIAPGITIVQVLDSSANDVTSDWSTELINPDYSIASGVESQQIWFYLSFTSAITDPLEFDLLLWNSGSFLAGVHSVWDGAGNITQTWVSDPTGYDRNPVPEPATMLLVGTGLVGLVGFRRKFKV